MPRCRRADVPPPSLSLRVLQCEQAYMNRRDTEQVDGYPRHISRDALRSTRALLLHSAVPRREGVCGREKGRQLLRPTPFSACIWRPGWAAHPRPPLDQRAAGRARLQVDLCATKSALCSRARRALPLRPPHLPSPPFHLLSHWPLMRSRMASTVRLLGRSMGSPSARDQTPCDSTPMARDTPKSTV